MWYNLGVDMILTAVLLALLVNLTSIIVIFALVVRKKWRDIQTFITPEGENQESPLGVALDLVARRFGLAVAMEVKTTFMGKESGLKRGEAAVAGDIAMDLMASSQPLIAGLLEGFPTLKKRLLKNPGLVGAALSLLGGNGKGGGVAPGGGGVSPGGGSNQSAFTL